MSEIKLTNEERDELISHLRRKVKFYNERIVDIDLSEEGLDKINSFRPEICVFSVCSGHDSIVLSRYPSISFKYYGIKISEDIVKILINNTKDSHVIHKRILNLKTQKYYNKFRIKYNSKNENFLNEIYESFKIICN